VRLTADFYLVKLRRGGTPPRLQGVIIRYKNSVYALRLLACRFMSRKVESRRLVVGRDYRSLAPRAVTPCRYTRLARRH
jgi:hypothetical protein